MVLFSVLFNMVDTSHMWLLWFKLAMWKANLKFSFSTTLATLPVYKPYMQLIDKILDDVDQYSIITKCPNSQHCFSCMVHREMSWVLVMSLPRGPYNKEMTYTRAHTVFRTVKTNSSNNSACISILDPLPQLIFIQGQTGQLELGIRWLELKRPGLWRAFWYIR